MTAVVLDASAALAWLLKNQETVASRAMLPNIDSFDFLAPFIFDWEVHNVLLATGRTSVSAYREMLKQLDTFSIALEPPTDVDSVLELAAETQLSLFDAAYLQLALQRRLPLMSRDGRLVEATLRRGNEVYDLR